MLGIHYHLFVPSLSVSLKMQCTAIDFSVMKKGHIAHAPYQLIVTDYSKVSLYTVVTSVIGNGN